MSADPERQEPLELFYQCPAGVIEIDDHAAGRSERLRHAAAKLQHLPGGGLSEPRH